MASSVVGEERGDHFNVVAGLHFNAEDIAILFLPHDRYRRSPRLFHRYVNGLHATELNSLRPGGGGASDGANLVFPIDLERNQRRVMQRQEIEVRHHRGPQRSSESIAVNSQRVRSSRSSSPLSSI